jgi:hypothetical protein
MLTESNKSNSFTGKKSQRKQFIHELFFRERAISLSRRDGIQTTSLKGELP